MNTRRTPTQRIVDFALGVIACFALLILMAWMDHKHSETDALQRSALVSNDLAAEHAAMRGPR